MKFLTYVLALGAIMVSAEAPAFGRLASVSLVDRDSGAVLPAYYYRGEYWVAGRAGARYAIEIRNSTGGRLLAVTSVDGVNVLSGATAGWTQTGYVFDPGESYQISGWRKSNSEVAAFTFTDSPNSYAARTGRAGSVGVIGVALFREQPPVAYIPPRVAQAAPEAPSADAGAAGRRAELANDTATTSAAPARAPSPPAKLGTGHGEREYSYVVDTEFHRAQSEPNEVIRIRYDSQENLIALGVIRRPRPLPPGPDPFPGSPQPQYVPDPPAG